MNFLAGVRGSYRSKIFAAYVVISAVSVLLDLLHVGPLSFPFLLALGPTSFISGGLSGFLVWLVISGLLTALLLKRDVQPWVIVIAMLLWSVPVILTCFAVM